MMNANELLFYLRGFFELVSSPSSAQIEAIRQEVLTATRVENIIVPIEVQNPIAKKPDCPCQKAGIS